MILLVTYQQQWFFQQRCLLERFSNKNELGETKPNRSKLRCTNKAWNCRLLGKRNFWWPIKLQKNLQADSRAPNTDIFYKNYQHTARKRCSKYIGDTGSTKLNLDQKKICSMSGRKPRTSPEKTFSERRIYSRASLFCYSETPSQKLHTFSNFRLRTKNLINQTFSLNLKVSIKNKKKWFSEKTALS